MNTGGQASNSSVPNTSYDFRKIEDNWRDNWFDNKLYRAIDFDKRPKQYILAELPYPSGRFLHAGHMMRYTVPEIYSRYLRMKGFNVLYPMGWDCFGLPAEVFAISEDSTPQKVLSEVVPHFRESLKRMGYAIDWDREVDTSDPNYYKWTQWMFLKLYDMGLVKKKQMPAWWCKELGTLADEEVVKDGKGNTVSERKGYPVQRVMMEQWVLDLPKYADKLLADLNQTEYTQSVKEAQSNWIGKKEGINIRYKIEGQDREVVCFTTRPDTNFGATFLVIAPEHPLVGELLSGTIASSSDILDKIKDYVEKSKSKSEMERIAERRSKTGVFTNLYAINSLNDYKMPVWVSDFVLGHVGTAAVVGVPGHDIRDFEFAKAFDLEVISVVKGKYSNYKSYLMGASDITDDELKKVEARIVEKSKSGDYKLLIPSVAIKQYLDLIARKLTPGYWNEVIGNEIVFLFKHKDGRVERIKYNLVDKMARDRIAGLCSEFSGDPIKKTANLYSYLASNPWYTDYLIFENEGVMINSGFLDGLDIHEATSKMMDHLEQKGWGVRVVAYNVREQIFSRKRYWGEPIPLIYKKDGNIEKVPENELPVTLPDLTEDLTQDNVSRMLENNAKWKTTKDSDGNEALRETETMPTWAGSNWYYVRYLDPKNDNEYASGDKMKYWLPVDKYFGDAGHTAAHLLYTRFWLKALHDGGFFPLNEPIKFRMSGGLLLGPDGRKMSKSRGNVVNAEEVLTKYGADAVRMYLASIGPYGDTYPWSDGGIKGTFKLMATIYGLKDLVVKDYDKARYEQAYILLNKSLKNITQMIEELKLNTAVSQIYIITNYFKKLDAIPYELWIILVRIIAPFAPYLAEELWQALNGFGNWDNKNSVHLQEWPVYDENLVKEDTMILAIQVDGKLRAVLKEIPSSYSKEQIIEIAKPKIQKYIDVNNVKNSIYVPGRILNFILKS